MEKATDIAQGALQCPNCGGQCHYAPGEQRLKCQSCGTLHDITHDGADDPAREFTHVPGVADSARPSRDVVHGCETCGGEVIFPGAALSQRCPYCDGPAVVVEGAAEFDTMALIPFQVTSDVGWANAAHWVATRRAAPGDLSAAFAEGKITGLYAPFFTFDSWEFVRYTANYTTGSGKNRRRRTERGSFQTTFDDLLAPASHHITSLIRDGVLHDFDPDNLRPYHAGYISGMAAERHHMSVAEGLRANEADKAVLIRNRIQRRSRRNLSNIRFQTDTSGIRYRRILLPVWIVHYSYRGRPYKVVSCGLRGTTFGERPFSRGKLFAYAGAMAAAAIAFGIFWGAAGLM